MDGLVVGINRLLKNIKIRVKTYAYSLMLRREGLSDLARRREELRRGLREKELHLLEAKLVGQGAQRLPARGVQVRVAMPA